MKEGNLTLARSQKLRPLLTFSVDRCIPHLFYICVSTFRNHYAVVQIHTHNLVGASIVKPIGWRDYDIQFRLKKDTYSSISLPLLSKSYKS